MKASIKKRIQKIEIQASSTSKLREENFKKLLELFPDTDIEGWDTDDPLKDILDEIGTDPNQRLLPYQQRKKNGPDR